LDDMSVVRILLGALGFAAFWAAFAWLASGQMMAAVFFFLWVFLLAPLLLPSMMFYWMRLRGRLTRLELKEPSPLRDYVLHCVLKEKALQVDLWLLNNSDDEGIFWFERWAGASLGRSQIILSRRWLDSQRSLDEQKREFVAIWRKIAELSPRERLIRTAQLSVWAAAMSPLEWFSIAFDKVLLFLGVKEMPLSPFWCQRFAVGLKEFVFPSKKIADNEKKSLKFQAPSVRNEPLYWSSWSLGPWALYPARCLHPAWIPLSHSENLLFF
jgi:hypothetical protein